MIGFFKKKSKHKKDVLSQTSVVKFVFDVSAIEMVNPEEEYIPPKSGTGRYQAGLNVRPANVRSGFIPLGSLRREDIAALSPSQARSLGYESADMLDYGVSTDVIGAHSATGGRCVLTPSVKSPFAYNHYGFYDSKSAGGVLYAPIPFKVSPSIFKSKLHPTVVSALTYGMRPVDIMGKSLNYLRSILQQSIRNHRSGPIPEGCLGANRGISSLDYLKVDDLSTCDLGPLSTLFIDMLSAGVSDGLFPAPAGSPNGPRSYSFEQTLNEKGEPVYEVRPNDGYANWVPSYPWGQYLINEYNYREVFGHIVSEASRKYGYKPTLFRRAKKGLYVRHVKGRLIFCLVDDSNYYAINSVGGVPCLEHWYVASAERERDGVVSFFADVSFCHEHIIKTGQSVLTAMRLRNESISDGTYKKEDGIVDENMMIEKLSSVVEVDFNAVFDRFISGAAKEVDENASVSVVGSYSSSLDLARELAPYYKFADLGLLGRKSSDADVGSAYASYPLIDLTAEQDIGSPMGVLLKKLKRVFTQIDDGHKFMDLYQGVSLSDEDFVKMFGARYDALPDMPGLDLDGLLGAGASDLDTISSSVDGSGTVPGGSVITKPNVSVSIPDVEISANGGSAHIDTGTISTLPTTPNMGGVSNSRGFDAFAIPAIAGIVALSLLLGSNNNNDSGGSHGH